MEGADYARLLTCEAIPSTFPSVIYHKENTQSTAFHFPSSQVRKEGPNSSSHARNNVVDGGDGKELY